MKTKINIDIADILQHKYPHGFHVPADIAIDTFLEFADDDWEHEMDIDVHELLAERRAIALIWDTEQLLTHYPHLTEDQAWEALQECERNYKGEEGLTWDDIAEVVNDRFPDAIEAKQRLLDQLQTLRRLVESLPDDVATGPAAYGEISACLDGIEGFIVGKGA